MRTLAIERKARKSWEIYNDERENQPYHNRQKGDWGHLITEIATREAAEQWAKDNGHTIRFLDCDINPLPKRAIKLDENSPTLRMFREAHGRDPEPG